MSDKPAIIRLNKVVKETNVGLTHIVEFLRKNGVVVENDPNVKIDEDAYALLLKEFGKEEKEPPLPTLSEIQQREKKEVEVVVPKENIQPPEPEEIKTVTATVQNVGPKILGKINLPVEKKSQKKQVEPQPDIKPVENTTPPQVKEIEEPEDVKPVVETISKSNVTEEADTEKPKSDDVVEQPSNKNFYETTVEKLPGLSVQGKIELPVKSHEKRNKNKIAPQVTSPKPPEVKEDVVLENKEPVEPKITESPTSSDGNFYETTVEKLPGLNILGKIDTDLLTKKKVTPAAPKEEHRKQEDADSHKKKRKRIHHPVSKKEGEEEEKKEGKRHPKKREEKKGHHFVKQEISEKEIDSQIKDTLARLMEKGNKSKSSKNRREKRENIRLEMEEGAKLALENKTVEFTEFVTANDLSKMLSVPINEIIDACMNLGLMVSINQRLDAEAITIIAENFGYEATFVSADTQNVLTQEEEDAPEDLLPRPPIVTVMGHVDHGKTSLLDSVRNANVIAGEAGGITQHIGAYHVDLPDGRKITFLDTPGHEAFTAMRARGAKATDVAVIVIAADDSIMPQTVEAINHAVAAGVPMIFAINKIDKEGADPNKIKEQLATMNYLVEDWGGKYQVQEIAAKKGVNIDKLLEKILLEADLLDLKANPKRKAQGTIIESSLDKGRGYVATILVQTGTLRVGDILLSGHYMGKIKAMFNERGNKITAAGPSTPVQILGLNGAPTAGENFNVMDDEKTAREIATKRSQLIRMQGLHTKKHITLDEIGRRIAIGNFKELNIIVKGDVDGSVEALTDALLKLSTQQVQVNVIHKAVGAISESDVQLAVASNAIIVGFQVRPSVATRRLAENEGIDIRTYSVIYDAINEIKDAITGMHAPEFKEEIVGVIEILQVFKINKVGSVAGCIVRDGKVTRNTTIRLLRDGIVIYTGSLGSLKRFKDDVKEVTSGFECGLNIEGFNDIKEGDMIEGFEKVEIKR